MANLDFDALREPLRIVKGDDVTFSIQFTDCDEDGVSTPLDITSWVFEMKITDLSGAVVATINSTLTDGSQLTKSASDSVTDTLNVKIGKVNTVKVPMHNASYYIKAVDNNSLEHTILAGDVIALKR